MLVIIIIRAQINLTHLHVSFKKKIFFRNLRQNLFYTTTSGMYGVIIIERPEHLILG